jgi:CRISPR-associated protein Cas1
MKKSLYIFKSGYLKRKQNTVYFEEVLNIDDNIETNNIFDDPLNSKSSLDYENFNDNVLQDYDNFSTSQDLEIQEEIEDTQKNSKIVKRYIPIHSINDIHIFSEVNINKKFIDFISQNKIPIHFYNYYGYYEGTYYPREFYNSGYIVLKQAEHYLNNEKRLYLAKSILSGAILNSLKVLNYYNRRNVDLNEDINNIESIFSKIKETNEIDKLLGLEGNYKIIYYKSFNKIVKNEDFFFEKRTKRPPTDFLNALISFGNSYLYAICLSEIYKTNLDPRIGFLHSVTFRRFSLNLDIAEIFRPILVDRAIFNLINKKVINTTDFNEDVGICYLNEDGKKKFLSLLEEKLSTTIKLKKLNRNVSFRNIIRLELFKIQKHLISDEEYSPFVIEY